MLLHGTTVGVGERLTGWVAATRQMIVNSPAALDLGERAGVVQPPMTQCLSVPLIAGERLVAVLTLYTEAGDDAVHAQRGRVLEVVAPHIAQALAATSDASRQMPKTGARELRLVATAS